MNIVHFSKTALAGGPYRLVSILRKHTNFNINLIDLKRWGRYPHDIVYEEEIEKALEVANKADIIHFHNYYDQYSRFFDQIDFRELKKKGVKFICQFRSEPGTIALSAKTSIDEIMSYDIPTIAIAQYPERFYPKAMVVPNAVPSGEPLYMPEEKEIEHDIIFTPTKKASAWKSRWNTKGSPETLEILNTLEKKHGYRVKLVSGKPINEVLEEKLKSKIVLDDMVTGSYHVSGLEALCQAKPVLCYIDNRISDVLCEITGTYKNPFINVRLEDAYYVLRGLLQDDDTINELGFEGRIWIDDYWSEEIIVSFYVELYKNLIYDPSRIVRQKSLSLEYNREKFIATTLSDLIYESRSSSYIATLSFSQKLKLYIKPELINYCRNLILRLMPVPIKNMLKKILGNVKV